MSHIAAEMNANFMHSLLVDGEPTLSTQNILRVESNTLFTPAR